MFSRMTKLRINAYVYPEDAPTAPLASYPKKLMLEGNDDETEHKVSFKNVYMDTLQLELVWAHDDYIEVEVPDSKIGPGDRIDVLVTVKKDRPERRFEKSFTVQVNDKDKTRMTVPVTFDRYNQSATSRSGK